MRRLTLSGTFLFLLTAVYFLWQHRFERSPSFPTLRLADLREDAGLPPGAAWSGPEGHPTLGLRVDPAHPRVVTRLELPGITAVDFLHLRFQYRASGLVPGRSRWEDGRVMIEWRPAAGGSALENNSICTARYDERSDVVELVTKPDHPPAVPALRVENLGASGDFELTLLEVTVVRERTVWKIGRWCVMAAWLGWALAWIGSGSGRAIAAAAIWVIMGVYFVIPGPWKLDRPIGSSYQIGGEISGIRKAAARPVESPPALPMASAGEIPDQGDFTLRLKHYAAKARPLLHVALLFGPALAIACLVGAKPARSLAAIVALAIEAAQFAFGYGFDWIDVFDLACDAAGIALALAVHHRLKRITPRIAG